VLPVHDLYRFIGSVVVLQWTIRTDTSIQAECVNGPDEYRPDSDGPLDHHRA
jgi:hypothetical protein